MSMCAHRLLGDRRGATAAEFALAVPVLLLMLFTVLQFGVLYVANAGLQNAVGEGARVATLWPRRSTAEITSEINAARFGLNPSGLSEPQLTYGQANGQDFVELRMTYTTDLDFIFFKVEDVQLQETRRAYMP
jgi:Flp pilus assembly protein TadG